MDWILIFFASCVILSTLCLAQNFQNYKILGVSEGQTCTPLPNPEHGRYKCKRSAHGEECELICDPGYIPPITYTPRNKLMAVEKRGLYKCIRVPGGLTWHPDMLYDCVVLKTPKHLVLHYGVSVPASCDKNLTIDVTSKTHSSVRARLHNSTMMTKCRDAHRGCHFQVFIVCTDTGYEADIEVYLPLTIRTADDFPNTRKVLDSVRNTDSDRIWNLPGKTGTPEISISGFFMDCPPATRIEGDRTCRGCSKGFYMDLSTSECVACPKGTYQDEDLQDYCKACPHGWERDHDGLRNRLHCFFPENYMRYTSIETVLMALFCVVVLATVILHYRSQVTNEPGPNTIEKDPFQHLLPQKQVQASTKAAIVGSNLGSGDYADNQDGPTQAQAKLMAAGLPLEGPVTTMSRRRARAKERLEMTLEVTLNKLNSFARPRLAQIVEDAEQAGLPAEEVPETEQQDSKAKQMIREALKKVVGKRRSSAS